MSWFDGLRDSIEDALGGLQAEIGSGRDGGTEWRVAIGENRTASSHVIIGLVVIAVLLTLLLAKR